MNLEGERFVDEGDVYYRLAQAVARQTRGMGIMIFDEQMFRAVAELRMSVPGTGASEGEKWEERARLEGDVLIKADSIEALAEKLAQRGPHETYKPNLLATIEECNRAADAGDGNLRIHRSQPVKLEHGPFYAWAFTAGVVYTMGGLAINTKAEVLDSQRAPIRGLYATPPAPAEFFATTTVGRSPAPESSGTSRAGMRRKRWGAPTSRIRLTYRIPTRETRSLKGSSPLVVKRGR